LTDFLAVTQTIFAVRKRKSEITTLIVRSPARAAAAASPIVDTAMTS
jgi:hypothetical protein